MIALMHSEPLLMPQSSVRSGLRCPCCRKISNFSSHHQLMRCENCNEIEQVDHIFQLAAKEYRLLFPDQKLTTRTLFNWCCGYIPQYRIARLLKLHYQSHGRTKNRYYLELNR